MRCKEEDKKYFFCALLYPDRNYLFMQNFILLLILLLLSSVLTVLLCWKMLRRRRWTNEHLWEIKILSMKRLEEDDDREIHRVMILKCIFWRFQFNFESFFLNSFFVWKSSWKFMKIFFCLSHKLIKETFSAFRKDYCVDMELFSILEVEFFWNFSVR